MGWNCEAVSLSSSLWKPLKGEMMHSFCTKHSSLAFVTTSNCSILILQCLYYKILCFDTIKQEQGNHIIFVCKGLYSY